MCDQINAEFVLANYFLHSSQLLTFGKLREIRVAIESEIKKLVYVDISTPSLASAVEMFPKMFRWMGDKIAKSDNSDSLFDKKQINSRFGYELDDSVRQQAYEVIVRMSTAQSEESRIIYPI